MHSPIKRNALQHKINRKTKLKPGLVASYDIRPGNGEGLFLFQRFINLSLIYLFTHPLTYNPGPTRGKNIWIKHIPHDIRSAYCALNSREIGSIIYRTESKREETSGQSNLTKRPHRRSTRTVQSYSPGCGNVHSRNGTEETKPKTNMLPWAHPSPQPERHLDRFSRFTGLTTLTDRQTDRPRYYVCNNRPRLRT